MSNQTAANDGEREKKTYKHPIPDRAAILAAIEKAGEPLSQDRVAEILRIQGPEKLEGLRRRLKAMTRDGQLMRNRKGRFGLVRKLNMVSGQISGHPDGFGFLVPDAGGPDVLINAGDMRQALHGDRVMVQVVDSDARGRPFGRIVEVLERAHQHVVGRLSVVRGVATLAPADSRISQSIVVPGADLGDARDGQMVVVELTQQPGPRHPPVGRVSEVLGDHMAPGMEIEVALRKHELPWRWPAEVSAEAAKFGELPSAEDRRGREDLRELPLVTIDGEDARDFDDAVWCERRRSGWRLIVAIADVSHYVKPDSALDQEAAERGNSVYFPSRVIPMLPESLSNGLCSLNPKVERLCMACEMEIDSRGRIRKHRFMNAVMRSAARLTYEQVAQALYQNDVHAVVEPVMPMLSELDRLYRALREAREERGALDLDLPETRIIFSDNQRIERIVPTVRNEAHRIIEECMLAANVSAATFLQAKKLPIPYRIHEPPTLDKLTDLRTFLGAIGLRLAGGKEPSPADYASLAARAQKRPDRFVIQSLILRSLSQARYSIENDGHFALGYDAYLHFTSPIRRYPDLIVHRAIKHALGGKERAPSERMVERASVHCSMTGRRADDATRDVIAWLKAEYMSDRVGDTFDGTITGVAAFGIFVQLDEVYVEGRVHITALGNDYYQFDPGHMSLRGERTGTVFSMGGPVRVRVARVDVDEAQIDFELVDPPGGPRRQGGRSGGKPGAKKQGEKPTAKKGARKGSRRRGGRGR
ncbi:MAG: ribonuclease R [Gammaproteobacteria bacterium]|nr:ribonuclease R [Gammaproteobacteria bacterium]